MAAIADLAAKEPVDILEFGNIEAATPTCRSAMPIWP
jgi:predicted nucleotidyltransferase